MSYNPATDFVGLWRTITGGVQKEEMPGLDFIVAGLGRAGLVNVTVSSIAPVANQSTTAWFQPASPSYSAEGTLWLWNAGTSAYVAATPGLFRQFLEASFGASGVSWFTTTGGAPSNTVGNNGDFAIRTDSPGGVYGPKAAGAWPGSPLPGTSYSQISAALDFAFGTPAQGSLLYRGAGAWQSIAPGTAGQMLVTGGAGANPSWTTVISATTISSTSANALAVGPNGVTNPTFNVDASTASAVTGVNIKSAAAGGGVAITATSSAVNEVLNINAKGSAQVVMNSPLNAAGGVFAPAANIGATGVNSTGPVSCGTAPGAMAAGDVSAARTAATGRIWFDSSGSRYIDNDGTNFNVVGRPLNAASGLFAPAANIGATGVASTGPVVVSGIANAPVTQDSSSGNTIFTFKQSGVQEWTLQTSATNFYVMNAGATAGVQLNGQASTSWSAFSDVRAKRDITTLSVLDKLSNFRAVRYVAKMTGVPEIGIIAQEQIDNFPELIHRGSDGDQNFTEVYQDGMWSAIYDRFGVVALQGVKELLQRLVVAEAEIAALKSAQSTP